MTPERNLFWIVTENEENPVARHLYNDDSLIKENPCPSKSLNPAGSISILFQFPEWHLLSQLFLVPKRSLAL